MRNELLSAAVQARAEKRPVVLVRCLASDERWLLDPGETPDGLDGLSESLRAHCYEALKRDGLEVASLRELYARTAATTAVS